MKSATLSTPFLQSEAAVRSVNFFNGRLLTAEDMKKQQDAEASHRRRLGRVFGEGVVDGLRVTIQPGRRPSMVHIGRGVAINGFGQAIELLDDVELSLREEASAVRQPSSPAVLSECTPPESGVYITGAGLYLLTVSPGAGLEGSVPVSGLGNPVLGGRVRCCGARHQVEGPTFRLTDLTGIFSTTVLAAGNLLRNSIARRLFTPERALAFVSDPLRATTERPVERPLALLGLAEDVRLRDSVPLALCHWTAEDGLVFADNWVVRRRPSGPRAAGGWPLQTGDSRTAAAEASWWQFQEHIDAIAEPAKAQALEHFTYLPPAGVLPVRATDKRGGFAGFDVAQFFTGFQTRDPIFVEGARVEHLMREALAYPPMDLQTAGSRVVWVYHVRENAAAVDAGTAGVRPYVVFTTAHVPYFGEARFDVGRWDYASYV